MPLPTATSSEPTPTVVEPGKPVQPVTTPVEVPAEAPAKTEDTASAQVEKPAETPSKATEPPVVPIEFSPQPEEKAEERVEEEIPPEKPAIPRPKPPLIRLKIFAAKKPDLMDLCKAYDLDPSGTKEQLRERLLSYLDDLERETPEEETVVEEERIEVEPTPEVATATEEAGTSGPSDAAQEVPTIEEKPAEAVSASTSQRVVAPLFVETRPPSQPIVEAVPAARPQPIVLTQAPAVRTFKAEHPCPTCGRELTYIAQYNRWYCYRCAAYAPQMKSKFACPNCGAKLRWIHMYSRWWCDSCRRYAPADLPKPATAAVVAVAGPASVDKTVPGVSAFPTRTLVHHHQNPGSGIGLLGFGLIVYVVYAFFAYLGPVFGEPRPSAVTSDILAVLQFFAFLFVALGAIAGLMALRHRD